MSFSSSSLEGNTYTYLDTEMLIKYNDKAKGKTTHETQMILNHKNAIKYIIDNKNEITLSKMDFQNIHLLLGKGLLIDEYLGKIRNLGVGIGCSTYKPFIKSGLAPFSFLQVNNRDYINAILAIYELNDVSLMSKIFVENYLLNMNRYI